MPLLEQIDGALVNSMENLPPTVPANDPAAAANPKRVVRGLSLLSGGLDSQLAVCVLRSQGIEMEAVVFKSPFFEISSAEKAAAGLNIKLHVVVFTPDIINLVKHPPHGFGSQMNPCIDCHAVMLIKAGEMMRDLGFDFVSTGEVLGQRPMSQSRRALEIVAQSSGIKDFLLRPLSALKLPPTPMELDGRVDRGKLLGLEGRNRRPQMNLAKEFGIVNYPSPAGGCRLTEPNYARRLRDLRERKELDQGYRIELLRMGRHFKLPAGGRLVVGRNKSENESIREIATNADTLIKPLGVPGPTALLAAGSSGADLDVAAGICASYMDHGGASTVNLRILHSSGGVFEDREVAPTNREEFAAWML
jgi:hypothetical protein